MPNIFVIADDLSGAAELAGIAAAQGLVTEVHRNRLYPRAAEVVAIDTDTRGSARDLVSLQMRVIGEQVVPTPFNWGSPLRPRTIPLESPAYVFKKVDSLLRGHPRLEVETLLRDRQLSRAILIPANPSRGRTIIGGQYHINGVPLDATAFADDPNFPRRSREVDRLLDVTDNYDAICSLNRSTPLPPRGIIVPDIASLDDIRHFAEAVDESTLPAGAADFFAAMLNRWNPSSLSGARLPQVSVFPSALLVCGSQIGWKNRREQCAAANVTSFDSEAGELAHSVFNYTNVADALRANQVVALGTGDAVWPPLQRDALLRQFADFAALLVRNAKPATLLLEGGATAAAVCQAIGWTRFKVAALADSGVGALKPIDDRPVPLVLIKPGSYPWPAEIWEAFCDCAVN